MKPFLRAYGPAVLSGMLLAFGFPGLHFWILAWVALVPLLLSTQGLGPRACFGRFLLSGYVFHAILLQWLLTHFYWAGGVAFFGHQLLTLYLALYWGWLGALWSWLRMRLPRVPSPLLLAVLWAAMEFLHDRMFGGFGWSSLGYSQGPDLAIVQLATLGGSMLVSAVVVGFNGIVAETVRRPKGRMVRAAVALALLAIGHGVGYALLGETKYGTEPFRVGVFQSNFPQEMKQDPEFALEMVERAAEKSRLLAARGPVELLVWPESIVTVLVQGRVADFLGELTRDTGAALFAGAARLTPDGEGQFNSSVLIGADGRMAAYYDKIHLAPFGEYVPFGAYLPFLQQVVPVDDLAFGETPVVLPVRDRRFGPLICFEVLFSHMADRLRRDGADFLVVITNLGWFGMSNALPQELEIARLRAIETRLPLVHAANTGISGVFDPWGRFQPLRGWIDSTGHYREETAEDVERLMIMRRGIQSFDLPLPGRPPLPYGPRVFPPLMLGVAMALTVAGKFFGRGRSDDESLQQAR